MIARDHPLGHLVFDRDAIVRAALRAYVEAIVANLPNNLSFPACGEPEWEGDVQRGGFYNGNGCGDYDVVVWTEAGVVGFAFEMGFGPIEALGLSVDAVTGGPGDVRAALPGLPDELEPALVMATAMLFVGPERGERMAGVGFWLHGGRVAGSLFDDPEAAGADRLAAWGLLEEGRLWPWCWDADMRATVAELARTVAAPIHAIVDAVTARALAGPTELTTDELATLLPKPVDPKRLLGAQRSLQAVRVTWPGSPEIPQEPRSTRDGSLSGPPTTPPSVRPRRRGRLFFDRGAIVRAALRAYVESILAWLDPLDRHPFAASFVPHWMGDLGRGAFSNADGRGSYEVVAWTEAGVVALAYERGFGPCEQLDLPVGAVTGGPDDVRAALPHLPSELEPALEMAAGMLAIGGHGEKLAGVGFWLHGDHIAGKQFHDPGLRLAGVRRLHAWGHLQGGRLRRWVEGGYEGIYVADLGPARAAPIHALVDAVTDRALTGPTELTTDEIGTLLPVPPDPERLLAAQSRLRKVGITWPGSPEISEEPQPTGANLFLPRP